MIQGETYEYSDDIRENVIMFALESQWRNTSLCLTKAEYMLHHQTFKVLGEYYRKIAARRNEALRVQNFIDDMQNGCETIQGGGSEHEEPSERVLQKQGSPGTYASKIGGESCR
jgi:hypothetical protein